MDPSRYQRFPGYDAMAGVPGLDRSSYAQGLGGVHPHGVVPQGGAGSFPHQMTPDAMNHHLGHQLGYPDPSLLTGHNMVRRLFKDGVLSSKKNLGTIIFCRNIA